MISIRRERPADIAAIRAVNEAAFEESAEADTAATNFTASFPRATSGA